MTEIATAKDRIVDEVTSWPGMSAQTGSRGELSLRFGASEIGHLHGNAAAHFGFPKTLWRELRDAGRITEHPVFPGRVGPAARRIVSKDDVVDVIALMRLNYDRLNAKRDWDAK